MMGVPPGWGAGRGGEKKEPKEAPKINSALIRGIKPTTVTGNIASLIPAMLTRADGSLRVQLVATHQPVANSPSADTDYNSEGAIGDVRVQVAGINCIAELSGKTLLASDSFASCVPVVVFGRSHTWLAHSAGTSAMRQILNDRATYMGAEILVIRKLRQVTSKGCAESMSDAFREAKFDTALIDIDTSERIGVLVSGIGKCILVYQQERGPDAPK